MLSRSHRLTTSTFAQAFRVGRLARHPLMQARVWARGDGDEVVRAAFVAPKKLGKACVRNRARRRVRERFRLLNALQNPQLRGCDLIFLLSPPILNASSAEIDTALKELLRRAARLAGEMNREAQNSDKGGHGGHKRGVAACEGDVGGGHEAGNGEAGNDNGA